MTRTNADIRLDISAGTTRPSILLASADLTPNSWTPILTNAGSTNGLYFFLDPMLDRTQRFYRITVP